MYWKDSYICRNLERMDSIFDRSISSDGKCWPLQSLSIMLSGCCPSEEFLHLPEPENNGLNV